MRRHTLRGGLVAAAAVLVGAAVACLAQAPPAGVPKERLARLAKGVNLSMWFAQLPFDSNRVRAYIAEDDARRMKALGLTFVRLPADPAALAGSRTPSVLDANRIRLLDAAVDLFLSQGLGVVLCPYMGDEPKARLLTDNNAAKAFGAFWTALAKHLAAKDPNLVFLEVLNEPSTNSQAAWDRVQRDLVPQIRRAAPAHTIVAASNMRANGGWDMIGGFVATQPVADKNVVYDFHFYDPVQFTHQGADWMTWETRFYKNVPYPSSPEIIRPHLAGLTDQRARALLELYGREGWGRQRVQGQLQRAIDWGRRNRAPVLCGEFGVYRPNCPAADRAVYLRDVREILETAGVGWAMWEYYGGFGVVIDKDGRRVVDPEAATALGLAVPLPPASPAASSSIVATPPGGPQ